MVVVFRVHSVETHVTTSDNNEALKLFSSSRITNDYCTATGFAICADAMHRDIQFTRVQCRTKANHVYTHPFDWQSYSECLYLPIYFRYRRFQVAQHIGMVEPVSEIRLFTVKKVKKWWSKSVNKTQSKTCSAGIRSIRWIAPKVVVEAPRNVSQFAFCRYASPHSTDKSQTKI